MKPCLLLVVEDCPAALAAARFTVGLARPLGARIEALSVLADGLVSAAVGAASGRSGVAERRDLAARSMLGHVARLARLERVEVETVELYGEIAERVLGEARRVRPDLIVFGRDEIPRPGGPAIAPWAARVLEFAEQPVVVVPHRWKPA